MAFLLSDAEDFVSIPLVGTVPLGRHLGKFPVISGFKFVDSEWIVVFITVFMTVATHAHPLALIDPIGKVMAILNAVTHGVTAFHTGLGTLGATVYVLEETSPIVWTLLAFTNLVAISVF